MRAADEYRRAYAIAWCSACGRRSRPARTLGVWHCPTHGLRLRSGVSLVRRGTLDERGPERLGSGPAIPQSEMYP